MAWLAVGSLCLGVAGILYALIWVCGAILFAIANGYRLKDFIKKNWRP